MKSTKIKTLLGGHSLMSTTTVVIVVHKDGVVHRDLRITDMKNRRMVFGELYNKKLIVDFVLNYFVRNTKMGDDIIKSLAQKIPPSPYLHLQYTYLPPAPPQQPYTYLQSNSYTRSRSRSPNRQYTDSQSNSYGRYRPRSLRARKAAHIKHTYSYGAIRYHNHTTTGCMRLFTRGRCNYKKCEWSHKTSRGPNKWLKTSYKGKTHYRSPDGRVWCTWSKRYGRYVMSDPY
jgi:hypothetical protein